MNLGLSHSRGKYIYFLNSDDSFYDPNVLQKVYIYLCKNPELDWVFGNIHETTGTKTIGFPPKRKIFQGRHPNILKYYNYIPHQGAFVKKIIFDHFGQFDERLRTMMDPEFWLRISPKTTWDYMPIIVANYLIRPDSQSENKQTQAQSAKEYRQVLSRYLSPLEYTLAELVSRAVNLISQMLQ